MTMPRGRVMALSRKEPTVKAKFSISSWALQLSQPFIQVTSSSCPGFAMSPTVLLVTFSVCAKREKPDHRVIARILNYQRARCTFNVTPLGMAGLYLGLLRAQATPQQAWMSIWPNAPGTIMQRFLTLWGSQILW